jgi:hypothetical protein
LALETTIALEEGRFSVGRWFGVSFAECIMNPVFPVIANVFAH